MDKFKRTIRIRTIWMSVVTICGVITNLILLVNQHRLPTVPDFAKGFQLGAFSGLIVLLVFFITKNILSMRNEKTLKKLYIEENDERKIMIMQKTGAMGMAICTFGLAFAAIIAGFFNQIVFFSLIGATLFTSLVRGFFKLYYYRKFSGGVSS